MQSDCRRRVRVLGKTRKRLLIHLYGAWLWTPSFLGSLIKLTTFPWNSHPGGLDTYNRIGSFPVQFVDWTRQSKSESYVFLIINGSNFYSGTYRKGFWIVSFSSKLSEMIQTHIQKKTKTPLRRASYTYSGIGFFPVQLVD